MDLVESHYAQLNVDLHNANIQALALGNKPINTYKAYNPKQREFIEWCKAYRFADGEICRNEKIILFLQRQVIAREKKDSRSLKPRRTECSDRERIPPRGTLSYNTIENYVSAIMNLWMTQFTLGQTQEAPKRSAALQNLLKTVRTGETKRRREEFQDRGKGTMLDGYSLQELQDCIKACWEERPSKKRNHIGYESQLRTAVDLLLAHSMLLRSESRRTMQLPDLFSIEMQNEGPTPCWAVLLVMDNGKTNKFGKIEYGAVVRHRDYRLCALSQLAFYFFMRWEVMMEPPPTFKTRQDWYNIHILKGQESTKPLSYDVQLSWTNQIFTHCKVSSIKKTHLGRGQGAKHAELLGVTESQIQRAGRWNNDAMSNVYLAHIPRQFVRAIAGFEPEVSGNYYITRAEAIPSDTLVRKVWPWIDQWSSWFNTNEQEDRLLHDENKNDLAGKGFLRLMKHLREILLQDSVLVRKDFPTHPIFQHSLFSTPEYLDFVRQAGIAQQAAQPEPYEVTIQRVIPAINTKLSVIEQSQRQQVKQWGRKLQVEIQSFRTMVQDVMTGKVPITLNAQFTPEQLGLPNQTAIIQDQKLQAHIRIQAQTGSQDDTQNTPQQLVDAPVNTHNYQMSRTIVSVHDAYREWTQGLGTQPSVQKLEEYYGTSWRSAGKDKTWFSRRKVLIDYINNLVRSGAELQYTLDSLENTRQNWGDRRQCISLAKLQELIKEQKI